jgi:ribosomal subunit interface protein
MELLVEGKDFEITQDVREFLEEKLKKISFAENKVTKVWVLLTKTPTNQVMCEVKAHLDHSDFFVSHEHPDWKISITDAVNKLHDKVIKERKKKVDKRLKEARTKRS